MFDVNTFWNEKIFWVWKVLLQKYQTLFLIILNKKKFPEDSVQIKPSF